MNVDAKVAFEDGKPVPCQDFPYAELDKEEIDQRYREAKRVWEAINRVLAEIIHSRNPVLTAEAIALASGLSVRQGYTETEIASKYGITRSAMSKRVKAICRKLDLDPSAVMKSYEACKSYSKAQKKRHEQPNTNNSKPD